MWRNALSVVTGLVAWVAIVSLINRGLRLALPGYAAAEPAEAFTLTMQIARLTMAAVTSLAAGAIVCAMAPANRWAPWITGGILLVLFAPIHIHVWDKFPVWYHLTFLITLAPLVAIGAMLMPNRAR